MRIIFFGTPTFAEKIFRYLVSKKVEVIAAVSQPEAKTGVKIAAEELHIPLLLPEKASDPLFLQKMAEFKPDLIVVAAYGQILKKSLLNIPPHGCINVHGSLLPKYRGAAPMQRALMNGDKETGVTIIQMNEKMDAGDVLKMASFPIDEEMNLLDLENRMVETASPLLLSTIESIDTINRTEQNHVLATLAPKIKIEETFIDWNRSAVELHNLIRALCPQPGARVWAEINGKKRLLKILKARPLDGKADLGKIIDAPHRIIVGCREGLLELLNVQPEGKKVMSVDLFLMGLQKPLTL